MGIKQFLADRKNAKCEKKSLQAYDLMMNIGKYSNGDQFMIRLQGDVEYFKPFFERIKVEGYDYQIDTIDGELFSPTVIYVRITKPGTMQKYVLNHKEKM